MWWLIFSSFASEPQYECITVSVAGSPAIAPRRDMSNTKSSPTLLPSGYTPIGTTTNANMLTGAQDLVVVACRRVDDGAPTPDETRAPDGPRTPRAPIDDPNAGMPDPETFKPDE